MLLEEAVSAFFWAENSWEPHCILQRQNPDAGRKQLCQGRGETEGTICIGYTGYIGP